MYRDHRPLKYPVHDVLSSRPFSQCPLLHQVEIMEITRLVRWMVRIIGGRKNKTCNAIKPNHLTFNAQYQNSHWDRPAWADILHDGDNDVALLHTIDPLFHCSPTLSIFKLRTHILISHHHTHPQSTCTTTWDLSPAHVTIFIPIVAQ